MSSTLVAGMFQQWPTMPWGGGLLVPGLHCWGFRLPPQSSDDKGLMTQSKEFYSLSGKVLQPPGITKFLVLKQIGWIQMLRTSRLHLPVQLAITTLKVTLWSFWSRQIGGYFLLDCSVTYLLSCFVFCCTCLMLDCVRKVVASLS